MPLNAQFFAAVRSSLYAGTMPQSAVDNFNTVCSVWESFQGTQHSTDDLAIILATVVIETGKETNLAVEEVGKGRGKSYGEPAGPYKLVYYGRGPCQITWLANYQKAKTKCGVDYVAHPELMCDPHYGVLYMVAAMYGGLFTGKSLRNYVTPGLVTTSAAFIASRAIINGTDRNVEHGGYCEKFSAALKVGFDKPTSVASALPALPSQSLAPTPASTPQRRGLVWDIARLLTGAK